MTNKNPSSFTSFTAMYIGAWQIYWMVNILYFYTIYSKHDAEKYDLSFLNSQWTLLCWYNDVILERSLLLNCDISCLCYISLSQSGRLERSLICIYSFFYRHKIKTNPEELKLTFSFNSPFPCCTIRPTHDNLLCVRFSTWLLSCLIETIIKYRTSKTST